MTSETHVLARCGRWVLTRCEDGIAIGDESAAAYPYCETVEVLEGIEDARALYAALGAAIEATS